MKIVFRKLFILKDVLISIFGGFQYGYNTAVIAGALLYISTTFSLTSIQEGLLVSIILIGAACSGSFVGILGNKLGRRWTMMLSALLFLIGTFIATFAGSYEILLIGRFISGLGCGIISTIVPIYCTEIAPDEKRGAFAHSNQIAMAAGTLFAYFCNYLFSFTESWRAMLGLGIAFALVQGVGLFFIKESLSESSTALVRQASWGLLFRPLYRFRVWVAVAIAIFQQLTGVTAVLYFAPTIFERAGYHSGTQAILATVVIGIINMFSILLSFWLIDRAGRRPLLIASLIGVILSLSLMAATLFLHLPDTLSLVSLMIFLASYSVGLGPITPLIMAEIFPTQVRGHAMTFAGFVGWIVTFTVALTFLSLANAITLGGTFVLFATCSIAGLIFIIKRIPETKNRSIASIEKEFTK